MPPADNKPRVRRKTSSAPLVLTAKGRKNYDAKRNRVRPIKAAPVARKGQGVFAPGVKRPDKKVAPQKTPGPRVLNAGQGRKYVVGSQANPQEGFKGQSVVGATKDVAKGASKIGMDATNIAMRQILYGPQGNKVKISTGGISIKPGKDRKGNKLKGPDTEPALKVLDIANRGNYASASAAQQLVKNIQKGESPTKAVGKAFTRGITGKSHRTYKDVLNSAGVHGPIADVGGFAADVLTDPTTYASLGAGSLARKGATEAAEIAARQAEKKVARSGLDRAAAEARRETAAKVARAESRAKAQGAADIEAQVESPAIRAQRAELARLAEKRSLTPKEIRKAENLKRNVQRAGKRKVARVAHKRTQDVAELPSVRAVAEQQAPSRVLGTAAGKRAFKGKAYTDTGAVRQGTVAHVGFVSPRVPFTRIGGRTRAIRFKLGPEKLVEREALSAPEQAVKKATVKAREVGSKVRPMARVNPESDLNQFLETRAAARSGRAASSRANVEAQRLSTRIAKTIPEEYFDDVVDVVEGRKSMSVLPSQIQGPAKKLVTDQMKYNARLARQAGVPLRNPVRPKLGPHQETLRATRAASAARTERVEATRTLVAVERAHAVAVARARLARTPAERARAQDRLAAIGERRVRLKKFLKSDHGVADVTGKDVARAKESLDKQKALRLSAPKKYFPHMRAENIEKGGTPTSEEAIQEMIDQNVGLPPGQGEAAGQGMTTLKRRRVQAPISKQNPHLPESERYSTDVPLVAGNTRIQIGRMQERAALVEGLRRIGRPIRVTDRGLYRKIKVRSAEGGPTTKLNARLLPGDLTVHPNEGVYWIGRDANGVPNVKELTKEEIANAQVGTKPALSKTGEPIRVRAEYTNPNEAGEFRVLDREAAGQFARYEADRLIKGRPGDKLTSTWKQVATATPGFHIRNMIGDMLMAGNDMPATDVVGALHDGVKQLAYMRGSRKAIGHEGPGSGKKIIDMGKAGPMTRKQLEKELHEMGVPSTGIRGGDVRAGAGTGDYQLTRAGKAGAVRIKGLRATRLEGKGKALSETLEDRENIMRIGQYMYFRRKGLSKSEASNRVAQNLIDYGELSKFERSTARRAAPFYTFSSRALPRQIQTLASRPGKVATFQKVRNDTAQAFGIEPEDLQGEEKYKQGLAGIPIKIGGKVQFLSFGSPMAQALNQLPTQGLREGVGRQLRYGAAALNPGLKVPIEAGPIAFGGSGYNTYFRSPIKSPYGDLVPAPSWASKLPDNVKENLHVQKYVDKKTGKTILGWGGAAAYGLNTATPGGLQYLRTAFQEVNQRGQTRLGQVANLAGIKLDASDKFQARLGEAFNRYNKLDEEIKRLNKGKDALTLAQAKDLDRKQAEQTKLKGEIQNISKDAGYKVPYFKKAGRKKKVKRPTIGIGKPGRSKSGGFGIGRSSRSGSGGGFGI